MLLLAGFSVNAQYALFDSSSTISAYGSVYSPTGESYNNIIDGDVETKFLDFNYYDGLGFTVDLNGYQTVATSMDFTTANDSAERDPTVFEIFGSNDGSYFTSIAIGDIYCDPERFYTTSYTFDNTQGYSYYRFIFSEQCNTIESMIQIAEVQLFGTQWLGNKDFPKNEEMKVCPNPNNGNFTISQNEAIGDIVISDALGKIVRQLDSNKSSQQINIEGVESGLYFLRTSDGSTKKLIIK
ncbi:MAG: T9SS type A sorting domain-containing protein [Flavobacterium sp.]|nr:MAG: T9SS type A sorting domain-containing protein [Flavobacterium sp.]